MRLVARGKTLEWPRPALVMGIVNLSADSFSGDGVADMDAALAKARTLIAEGADMIDIGAESARTNRGPISVEEEAAKLCAFVERWPELSPVRQNPRTSLGAEANEPDRVAAPLCRGVEPGRDSSTPEQSGAATTRGPSGGESARLDRDHSPFTTHHAPLLSINTWRPAVARAVLARGGDLLNDIGGLPNGENARLCAETGAALLIMHSVGEPKVPHTHIGHDDIMARLDGFFAEKIALAAAAGVSREAIVLDPGLDFAKQRADNLRILRELERLHRFERPVLVPISRKTFIGEVLDLPTPADRDAGTIACLIQGLLAGAHIFRVHNVRAAVQARQVVSAVEGLAI